MVSEDFLRDRAEEAVEALADGVDVVDEKDRSVKVDKRNEFDDKLEKDLETDEAVWSREEIEFLANNRSEMSNDELEEFLNRQSDFQEEVMDVSWTEKRFVRQNFASLSVEEMAERMDRPESQVEKIVEMMGLN